MPSSHNNPHTGSNLILASSLAVLSYVPFEWVAKGSLLAAAILFIWDPIPPLSRLLSIFSLAVVFGINKAYRQHLLRMEQEEQEILVSEEEKIEEKERPGLPETVTGDSANKKVD